MRGLINLMPLFLLYACFTLEDSKAIDTITITEPIQDPQSIVSSGQTYRLGFFSPVNTSNSYVGIILNIPELTVIWVANRDRPLKDSAGIVTISKDGNIVVLNGQKDILWSSNVSNPVANSTAQLLDTGNLVLTVSNGTVMWESFQVPTNYFVKKMKLGVTVNNRNLITSWKSPSDPSIGSFSLGFDPPRIPEIFLWNNSKPYWRSGPWNGLVFIGIPGMISLYNNVLHIANENNGTAYFTYDYSSTALVAYYVLTPSGTFLEKVWYAGTGNPKITWTNLQSECDVYGKCGPFGLCNPRGSPICSCLQGFQPTDEKEWERGNWTGGCFRKAMLQCERNSSADQKGQQDGFLKLSNIKVPDFSYVVFLPISGEEPECGNECLNNCSCIAYSFNRGIGCMHWSSRLLDMQQFNLNGSDNSDLHLRVAYSELDYSKSRRGKIAVIASIVTVVSILIIGVACFLLKWFAKSRGEVSKMKTLFNDSEELHLYSYDTLAVATENFHCQNMLGKGGFGPVYKGKLINGQEIAVKRLSNSSSQGSEEFMNEVLVISKLQHRNLVRLLGCCVERDEKMLVYEYMPNKSLDAYLFGSLEQDFLDWNRRRIVIEGIIRGLLYLHRDSRLKIIHRDLKTSNILLDAELNPKISDFGLARIFGGNQEQANTNRVVGTYGYMAPEYAMRGKISDKSDVYSFGVLLLEILSGNGNVSFYNEENDLSLIGHAWKLWHENETAKFIDPSIFDRHNEMEFSRYVQVGLLCVQEHAKDRPNMPAVLSMLNSEIAELPRPKLPAYAARMLCSTENGSCQQNVQSSNDLSITTVIGR